MKIQKICSDLEPPEKSPYPTVVIVVTVKYTEARYISEIGSS